MEVKGLVMYVLQSKILGPIDEMTPLGKSLLLTY